MTSSPIVAPHAARRLRRALGLHRRCVVATPPTPYFWRMDTCRNALRAIARERGWSINRWAALAGIDSSGLYAYLNGRAGDITLSRAVALARAAGVSLDRLAGIEGPPRDQLLDRILPLLERHGPDVPLALLAEAGRVSVATLQAHAPTMDDLIALAYVRLLETDVPAWQVGCGPIGTRLRATLAMGLAWATPRAPLFAAVSGALVRASPAVQEAYARARHPIIQRLSDELLPERHALLPLDRATRFTIADLILQALAEALRAYASTGDPKQAETAFLPRARAILLGKFRL